MCLVITRGLPPPDGNHSRSPATSSTTELIAALAAARSARQYLKDFAADYRARYGEQGVRSDLTYDRAVS